MFKFCPKCGGFLNKSKEPWLCLKCGFKFFQNSKPTVGAIIQNSLGRVLLAKRAVRNAPAFGKWDIPGGFLGNGEDPIAGLKRETKEEIGAEIQIQKILGIYVDKYTFEGETNYTFNVVYVCVLLAEPKTSEESSELVWFSRNDIPWDDLAFENIKLFLHDYFSK